MAPEALIASLELLWGMDPSVFKPLTGYTVWVERPWGFRVAEPRASLDAGGSWLVYLVARTGDTLSVMRSLKRSLGARRASVYGLKDACAIAYQYMAVERPRRAESVVEGRHFKAWLVGSSREPLRPGAHGYNIFMVEMLVDGGDPGELCRAARAIEWVPAFYGPQRFGVERPNTGYMGLLRLEGRPGALLAEYRSRYPLEEARGPGYYEAAALRNVATKLDPLEALRSGRARLHVDAFRAYIFNRALSQALRLGLEGFAERWVRVRCPQGPVRVPAARLPGRRRPRGTRWAALLSKVMGEEGLAPGLPGMPVKPGLRPLYYPVCRLACRPLQGRARIWAVLPSGAYLTVLLRRVAWVDWLRYAMCKR